jgi:gamma-glutamyltranspeptidase/glutathione hydrolase
MRSLVLPVVLLLCGFVGVGCSAEPPAFTDVRVGQTIEAEHGVVVSVCPIASRVGADVLRNGGNAVDASVATAFALAVTWPEAGNIGGGGFMMVHGGKATSAGQLATFIDYRETAPAAVTPTTFSNKPNAHTVAGTPGTVRGMHDAYTAFGSGKVKWKDLVLPSVKLARDGFLVNRALADSLNSGLRVTRKESEFHRVYGKPDGTPWQPLDRMTLPDLADTLQRIADEGPAGFYEGKTARLVEEEMKLGNGLMTAADLKAYKSRFRAPVIGSYRGYTIIAPPMPSSGGRAMLKMLDLLEKNEVTKYDRFSTTALHLIAESCRRAYADRARFAGDPDYPTTRPADPPQPPFDDRIDLSKAGKSDPSQATLGYENPLRGQTTHFSVADADGMCVSNTYTLEQNFGGKVVVRGAGFLLNNELGDFNPVPGLTDETGKIGTPPNVAQPGKRPLSSMTPTIILNAAGKPVLVVGSPGGRTIINTVTQVVLNRLAFNMTLRDAVDAPRIHQQWLPDAIRPEKSLLTKNPKSIEELKALGHTVAPPVSRQGDAHSIEIDPKTGKKIGVADPRIGGGAAGY